MKNKTFNKIKWKSECPPPTGINRSVQMTYYTNNNDNNNYNTSSEDVTGSFYYSRSSLCFQFLLPVIQVSLICLCIGGDPNGIRVAVVNNETSPSAYSRTLLSFLDNSSVQQVFTEKNRKRVASAFSLNYLIIAHEHVALDNIYIVLHRYHCPTRTPSTASTKGSTGASSASDRTSPAT